MSRKEVTLDECSCPNPNCKNGSCYDIEYGSRNIVDSNVWEQKCVCKKCKLEFVLYYSMTYDITAYEEDKIREVPNE